ncbi:phospholipase D-like domain-containing protein [Spiroplasma endosymbiont of Amphibalanus improvisus]|uniref:phospholipase D-like domain-containing protein n=1 Tax=Spiroplasma endosymbiont of Amphibalanus improvisus TaxID=3066327 RepID=UPI00313DF14A
MRKWLKVFITWGILYSVAVIIVIVTAGLLGLNLLWTFLAIELVSFIMSLWVFYSDRRDEVRLSWIVFLIFFPIIGPSSYFFWGRKYKNNKKFQDYEIKIQKRVLEKYGVDQKSLIKELDNNISYNMFRQANNLNRLISKGNDISVMTSGPETMVNILNAIREAKETIYLDYYILENGELFDNLMILLEEALKRKVRVYLLYDYVGSLHRFDNSKLKKIIKNGAVVYKYGYFFMPWFSKKANFRNHRKNVVVDGRIAFLGGVNIGDLFTDQSTKIGIYKDATIKIYGPAVLNMEVSFAKDIFKASNGNLDLIEKEKRLFSNYENKNKNKDIMTMIDDQPSTGSKKSKHIDMLISLISSARKRVWLTTPYLLLPAELKISLINAVKSGLDVRIIIPGLNDKSSMLDLSRADCSNLFAEGIKIYELNNCFIHSKLGIYDDVVTIGTTNLDYRSFFSDEQSLAFIQSTNIAQHFSDVFEDYFDSSTQWKKDILLYKSFFYRKIFLKLFSILLPIL